MTFSRPMIAAALLLASTAAFAGDISTDGARARAAATTHAGHPAPVSAVTPAAVRAPTSTDQARDLAAGGPVDVQHADRHMAASAADCACHRG